MGTIERVTKKVVSIAQWTLTLGIIAFLSLLAFALFLILVPSPISDYAYEHEWTGNLLVMCMNIAIWTILSSFGVLIVGMLVLLCCRFRR